MVTDWNAIPSEIANLLNPAFCSVIIHEACIEYHKNSLSFMPYTLSFLVLPLILHKPTRESLPRDTRTKFHRWVHSNEHIRVNFHNRAKNLGPYTKDALLFCSSHNLLTISDQAELIPESNRLSSLTWTSSSDTNNCRTKAKFLGRWLAKSGEVATIYTLLGVRP